jgi:AraC family transcriptional regulator
MDGRRLRYSPTRFPAPVVRTRAAGDFLLTETHYAAGAVLPTHAHEYGCLVIVLDGTFDERVEAKARAVAAGSVIVRPEGEPHSDSFGSRGGRCLNVEMRPQWLARVREAAGAVDRSAAHSGGAFTILGRRFHAELVNGDELSALMIESLVLGLFAEAWREDRRDPGAVPRWLLRAKQRIDDDPAARVTLDALATVAGVHPVHLATTFRRCFGRTVAAYVRQLRIELACRELARSDAPLADIALAAGFSDQSHFGRNFKQAIGLTPAAYRTAMRRVPAP